LLQRGDREPFIDEMIKKCPYGLPGDILWVRETWRNISIKPIECPVYDYKEYYSDKYYGPPIKWNPSIHMPRKAARIFLEVVSVGVERLQDITREDAKSEGVTEYISQIKPAFTQEEADIWRNRTTVENFSALWNTINAKRGYGWDTNPWVWVVEFRQVTP